MRFLSDCQCAMKMCNYFVFDRREKTVQWFPWQLDVLVGHRICKMWTTPEHFQKLGEKNRHFLVQERLDGSFVVVKKSVKAWVFEPVHTSQASNSCAVCVQVTHVCWVPGSSSIVQTSEDKTIRYWWNTAKYQNPFLTNKLNWTELNEGITSSFLKKSYFPLDKLS